MEINYSRLRLAFAMLFVLGFFSGYSQTYTFVNPIPIPDTIDGPIVPFGVDVETHSFCPNDTTDSLYAPITTIAYNHAISGNNTYLGPTLIWRAGLPKQFRVRNNLDEITTVHWHGAHIPAWTDGGPHQVIAPNGGIWEPDFIVRDSASTLWYHPHGLDETYTQMEMGASGLIIVRDREDTLREYLPHRYGVDDFPILIQDRAFVDSTGNGEYYIDTTQAGNGKVKEIIVNGVTRPYLEVPPQLVRFRVLDGSGRRSFQLGIGDSSLTPQTFNLIASDGGYLGGPEPVTTFLTSVGIRNEIVMDFTGHEGESFYLLNQQHLMPPRIIGAGPIGGQSSTTTNRPTFMEFRVQGTPVPPLASIPPAWPPTERYDTLLVTKNRTKEMLDLAGGGFSINNLQFEIDSINDIVFVDSTEIWTIKNPSKIAHPFHIHDVQFFVIDVRDSNGVLIPTPVEFKGPNDNILVQVGWSVRFVTQFTNFATSISSDSAYMYHCHILTHEDGFYGTGTALDHYGMMQQFVVTNKIPAGTPTQDMGENMILYPNPATDILHLNGESTKPSSIRITDLQGRVLRKLELPPFWGTTDINLDGLGRGLVLVEWSSRDGSFVRKVMLK